MDDNKTAVQVIQQLIDTEQFGKIYLGGSRRMHQLSGDEDALERDAEMQETIKAGKGWNLFDPLTPHTPLIPIKEDTDYDYYATYTPELEEYLSRNGFDATDFVKALEDSGSYSLDDEALTIMERDDVQVVLRNDAEFYRAVFDNIEPWFYKQYLWKSSGESTVQRDRIQEIFNMLFDIARAAQHAKAKK